VSVVDSGVGLPPQHPDQIFNGFWRTVTDRLLASIALAVLTFVAFRLGATTAMAALFFLFFIVLISLWARFRHQPRGRDGRPSPIATSNRKSGPECHRSHERHSVENEAERGNMSDYATDSAAPDEQYSTLSDYTSVTLLQILEEATSLSQASADGRKVRLSSPPVQPSCSDSVWDLDVP
jgi:hypothetical protein